jgi:hypothetical protein
MQTPEFDRRSAATAIAVFGGPQRTQFTLQFSL